VHVRPDRIGSNDPQQPQDHKNYKDCPKHRLSPV
jgi:hypothetical protein